MVCNITCTKRSRAGVVLADLLIGTALSSVLLALVASLVMFCARSFAATANYVILDQRSRNALDRMSKEIRQCNRLISSDSYNLELEDADGGTLRYTYSPSSGSLFRIKNGTQDPKPLLKGCTFLQFSIFQRNPISGSYDQYPTATASTCKLVQMSWICAINILSSQNTESVQSAKVVIRNQAL